MTGLVNLDVGGIFGGINDVIKKSVKDVDLARKLEAELRKAQLLVNATEAQHSSLFVAGWRPFIGWVCGVALCYNFLLQPILSNWWSVQGIELSTLENILMGMLGLGGARTIEKVVGVARSNIGGKKKRWNPFPRKNKK